MSIVKYELKSHAFLLKLICFTQNDCSDDVFQNLLGRTCNELGYLNCRIDHNSMHHQYMHLVDDDKIAAHALLS